MLYIFGFVFVCLTILFLQRKKKGTIQEKDFWYLVMALVAIFAGLIQVEIKYEAINKIEKDIRGIQRSVLGAEKEVKKMRDNIVSIEKNVKDTERNVKKIAETVSGISKEGARTKIKGGLTITN